MKFYGTDDVLILFASQKLWIFGDASKEVKEINLSTTEIGNPEKLYRVAACAISKCGTFLAMVTSLRKLFIYNLKSLCLVKETTVPKSPTSIAFSKSSDFVLVGDKAGDVYSFGISENSEEHSGAENVSMDHKIDEYKPDIENGPEPAMGHLSMILDLIVTEDGKFVITSDRDEKIRISSYPNMYNIHGYCLGHTEFVSKVLQVPGYENLLISCSGDSSIRLWNYHTGTCLETVQPKSQAGDLSQDSFFIDTNSEQKDENLHNVMVDAVTQIAIVEVEATTYIVSNLYGKCGLVIYRLFENRLECSHVYPLSSSAIEIASFGGEFLAVRKRTDDPLLILQVSSTLVSAVSSHPCLDIFKNYRQEFIADNEISIGTLYKQRFDNVTPYLAKKEARLGFDSSLTEEEPSLKKIKASQKLDCSELMLED